MLQSGLPAINDSDHGTGLTLSGLISGPGGLAILADHGPATVIITGANNYSGQTQLLKTGNNAPTVIVGSNTALGTGPLYMEDGSTLQAGASGLSLNNVVELEAGSHTFNTNGSTLTLTGLVRDFHPPGALTKAGAGTLKLTNAETYTGGTTLSGGTLELGNGGSIPGNVSFAGVNATIRLDTSDRQIGGSIAGMVFGDAIDLAFIPLTSGVHATWQQQNGNGGVLSVVNGSGTTLASLSLLGSYKSFQVMGDGSNGTSIVLPPPLPNTREIFWHDASGANLVWALNQSEQIIGGPNLPTTPTSWNVAGVGDFNNDGISDLVWRDASGANQIWNMDVTAQIGNGASLPSVNTSWSLGAVGNFRGVGFTDLLWHNLSGQNLIWNIQNVQMVNGASLPTTNGPWVVGGVGYFRTNTATDVVWRNTQTGQNLIWNIQNNQMVNGASLPTTPTSWSVVGIGAFGGNGRSEILWHNASGQNLIWVIQNNQMVNGFNLPSTASSWTVAGIADFTGSGTDGILWHNSSGENLIWNMQNNQLVGGTNLPTTPTSWNIAGVGINSITSGLSTGADGDPALSQMVPRQTARTGSRARSRPRLRMRTRNCSRQTRCTDARIDKPLV